MQSTLLLLLKEPMSIL